MQNYRYDSHVLMRSTGRLGVGLRDELLRLVVVELVANRLQQLVQVVRHRLLQVARMHFLHAISHIHLTVVAYCV